jgi:hypothetical protein
MALLTARKGNPLASRSRGRPDRSVGHRGHQRRREAGGHQLRSDATGRIYLGPEVAIDWHCFCELVRRSKTAQTTRHERELLRRAMHLVRGPGA